MGASVIQSVPVDRHTVFIQYEVRYINILAIMFTKPEEADHVRIWTFSSWLEGWRHLWWRHIGREKRARRRAGGICSPSRRLSVCRGCAKTRCWAAAKTPVGGDTSLLLCFCPEGIIPTSSLVIFISKVRSQRRNRLSLHETIKEDIFYKNLRRICFGVRVTVTLVCAAAVSAHTCALGEEQMEIQWEELFSVLHVACLFL